MSENKGIFGCYVSCPATIFDENKAEQDRLTERELLSDICREFRHYIWGEKGINQFLEKLNYKDYGNDLELALFQFKVKPLPNELEHLKPIESYRKREKSIGIWIIINDENFFNKTEEGRYEFLKQSILQKIDLLVEVVVKNNLDTNIDLLKDEVRKTFEQSST